MDALHGVSLAEIWLIELKVRKWAFATLALITSCRKKPERVRLGTGISLTL
jgi:hypothetical protein